MPVSLHLALNWLRDNGSQENLAGFARFGIVPTKAFGVNMDPLRKYGRAIGPDHALAQQLWDSGWYEARLLAVFTDDPAQVTLKQMNAWAAEFDNWAIVDTACFALFDRAAEAWKAPPRWAKAKAEFHKRAAFALLWSLSLHDKKAPDTAFLDALKLIEQGAADERHYVQKAVDMALRAIGKRNRALNAAATTLARTLASRDDAPSRWVGKHALKELASPAVARRLKR